MKLLTLILLASSVYTTLTLAADKVSGLPTCVVCHGSNLQGNIVVQAPNLSILPAWYITSQLEAYQHNWRGEDASLIDAKDMRAVAVALKGIELDQALKFIESMKPQTAKPRLGGDQSHGQQLFASCSACHGEGAQGNAALKAPPLAGQNDWYIFYQLKDYQANIRGHMPDDSSGNMMRNSAKVLSTEQDLLDVASYLVSLKTSKE
jgi:cytochrome c553